MSLSNEQQQLVNALEDTYVLLQKAQTNLKKCSKQRLTRGYIEARLQSIEGYWKNFVNTHQELVKCTPKCKKNEVPYFLNEDYFVVEDLYSCIVGDLRDMLSTSSQQSQPQPMTSTRHNESIVKLPRIEIPKFAGSYDDWPTFRDLFTSLIHNNFSLSKVEKLHYLKTSVISEPAELLKHVYVLDSNYEQAWNILNQRYGNKRLIVNSLLHKLFNLKKLTSPAANHLKNLVDTTTQCLNNLKNQDIPTDSWDQIIIYLVVQKLDMDTHRDWEEHSFKEDSNRLPTWAELRTFLETKFRSLEMVNPTPIKEKTSLKAKSFYATTSDDKDGTVPTKTCSMCKADHNLCHCKEFSKLQPGERSEFIKKNRLCFNCMMGGHSVIRCRVPISCRICRRRHHTLLHANDATAENVGLHHSQIEEREEEEEEGDPKLEKSDESDVALSTHFASGKSTALLATALVIVRDDEGHSTILRALLDQGSQANFITERAAQLLKIKRTQAKGTITGVGSTQATVNHMARVELLSNYEKGFKLTINTYIMPTRLTSQLPSKTITVHNWPHLQGLTLADPSFNTPGRIDMLLGVEVYAQILKPDILKGPPGSPCAQNTNLGWVLFGNIQAETSYEKILVMHHQFKVDDMLKTLWEVDTDITRMYTKDEERCEKIYKETHTRNEEGRYTVKLPFKTATPKSPEGNTRDGAFKRLQHLERRFKNDEKLKTKYTKAIDEYSEMGHMEEVPEEERENPAVYLPHHPVFKYDSETTQIRPVFDASYKGTNNVALNDELLIGPQLQEDIRSLVMRWRLKRVAFVSDIQKMYRQVLIAKEDKDFQRILWRTNTQDSVKEYRLLRVTFGTACAPYLAVRTLQQIAEDEGQNNLIASDTIKQDFYMDDLMSGQDTVEEALELARGVSAILKKGGFVLQKWASNSAEFLKGFDPSELSSHVNIDIKLQGLIKTLGLSWNMGDDMLEYHVKLPPFLQIITKRKILADVQTLFDPLGWLAPALVPAKLIIQKLWLQGVQWDEELEPEIKNEWLEIRESLNSITNIKINRWLGTTQKTLKEVTIHGYCDASMKAYGAVAYLRVMSENGEYNAYIIAAKTKVAPIKSVSLPRLELCGAVLLSRLLKQISEAMRIPMSQIFCWTDSMIVLSWLQGDPNRWQTFVRNRVITILDNVGNKWYHISSQNNPADIASRGMLAPELMNCTLWWHGPEHLKQKSLVVEKLKNEDIELERVKTVNTYLNVRDDAMPIYKKLEMFKDLSELLKTVTYAKRFLNYFKTQKDVQSVFTPDEIEEALYTCIKITQEENFKEEIQDLKEKDKVKTRSPLRTLHPYLDSKDIIRVGGRIKNSELDYNRKHPIILDNKGPLTSLLIADAHKRTLHGGVDLMLNYLRSKYWIFKAKNSVKAYIRRCLVCARINARARSQLMGELPKVRVTPARPFLHSGVDFAGPYDVLMSRGRGAKTNKAYISIFVCMSTKAVHLELVGDLTAEAFIGAFRRFVSRRGRCSDLWSDQGRNFVRANKELADALTQAKLELNEEILELLASDGTQWHFIPVYSPNMGGVWEAGVKSMKYHLKRIINTHLTFEEMTTLLCQVEACLNSRPLCPMDNTDLNSLNVLTPGHFLIEEPPLTIPSPSLKDISMSSLSRWQFTQKLLSNFWARWQQEYLTKLQQRPKWMTKREEFEIGQVVLIKTEGMPPGKWHLGRIVDKHPGPDGLTRVYSVKSGNSIVKRSISKLCFIPVDDNDK